MVDRRGPFHGAPSEFLPARSSNSVVFCNQAADIEMIQAMTRSLLKSIASAEAMDVRANLVAWELGDSFYLGAVREASLLEQAADAYRFHVDETWQGTLRFREFQLESALMETSLLFLRDFCRSDGAAAARRSIHLDRLRTQISALVEERESVLAAARPTTKRLSRNGGKKTR